MSLRFLQDVDGIANPSPTVQANFDLVESWLFRRSISLQSGVATTIKGPPLTGTWVLRDVWTDALLGKWICTVAGTPGTWMQIVPAIVRSNPAAPVTGYWIARADQNYAQYYYDGAAYQPVFATSGSITTASITDMTAAGVALATAANAAAQRTALGLGTLATQSGTFSGTSSGTNTGDQTTITGNAGTATALQTARTINGVSFDGTGNITVAAAAGTLTGATLAANVLASSLTSVGTLATLTVTAAIVGSVTGNAGTATALQNARTINGVSFDGTGNISVTAAAGTLSGSTLASGVTSSSLTSFGANPVVGTQSPGDNSTRAASTAYADAAVAAVPKSKSYTLENPVVGDNALVLASIDALTLSAISCVLKGSGSPSVTFQLYFGTDRSGAGTAVFGSAQTVSSTTTMTSLTIANGSVPSGGMLWLVITSLSNTVSEISFALKTG